MSDPSGQSLAAISRTLSYFGIKSEAYKTNIVTLKNTTLPIVHTSQNDGHFFVLKDMGKEKATLYDEHNTMLSISNFINIWDGIVLVVEKESRGYEVHNMKLNISYCFFSLVLLLFTLLSCNSVPVALVALLDFLGIYTCYILGNRKLGLSFNNNFCKIGGRFDCDYVSNSLPIKGNQFLSLEGLGILYFVWDLITLCSTGQFDLTFVYLGVIAFVFCILLFSYQILIIRKYCFYCLCIYAIVAVKVAIGFIFLEEKNSFGKYLLLYVTDFFISLIISFFALQSISIRRRLLVKSTELLKIKRIPFIFHFLSSKMEDSKITEIKGLSFGNQKANCLMDLVVTLECKHCRRAILEVSRLLSKYPNKYYFNIIIVGDPLQNVIDNELFVKIYQRELSIYERYGKNYDWYSRDLSLLLKKAPIIHRYEISDKTIKWYRSIVEFVLDIHVNRLPVILVNGKLKPQEYKITDYQYLFM